MLTTIFYALAIMVGCLGGSQFYVDVDGSLKAAGFKLSSWRRLLVNAAMLASVGGVLAAMIMFAKAFVD